MEVLNNVREFMNGLIRFLGRVLVKIYYQRIFLFLGLVQCYYCIFIMFGYWLVRICGLCEVWFCCK